MLVCEWEDGRLLRGQSLIREEIQERSQPAIKNAKSVAMCARHRLGADHPWGKPFLGHASIQQLESVQFLLGTPPVLRPKTLRLRLSRATLLLSPRAGNQHIKKGNISNEVVYLDNQEPTNYRRSVL